jgi:hypothetical protein
MLRRADEVSVAAAAPQQPLKPSAFLCGFGPPFRLIIRRQVSEGTLEQQLIFCEFRLESYWVRSLGLDNVGPSLLLEMPICPQDSSHLAGLVAELD